MNAVKRLLAIALALILSLTTLALPAMAVEITDEEIAPYALWGYCPKCAEMAKCTDRSEFGLRRSDAACPLGSSPKVHTHCDELELRRVFKGWRNLQVLRDLQFQILTYRKNTASI